jgi:serine/threonine-protein kinase
VALLVAASLAAWAVWRTRTTPVPAAALPPTIAVLPFLNFSGDSTDDYLGDSISEELTEALAELNDLRVVSRTSAFQYKGKNADAREIGKNLRAGAILEGSIARRGGKFHVVAQLIRTSDGYHLWSRSYDAAPADLTPVEASIARSAYETLLPTPLSVTARNDASTTRNPEAHDLYMRAVYELNLRTEASVRQSIDLARKATAADPSFARPWVAMAAGESQLNTLLAQSPHSAAERAWQDISKALELDPRNSGAHAQRAILAYTDHWDWPEAEREFRLATAGGSHGSAENLYGWCLITRGRFKEAKSRLQRASELDPLSLGPQLNQVAELVAEQDLKEARHKAEQVLSIAPRSPAVLATAALVAYRQRDCAWDTDLSRRLDEAYPHTLIARMTAVAADDLCGRPEDAKRALAAIVNDQSPGYVSPFSLATAMALSNDSEKALFYLEKSAEFREPVLMLLKVDQAFAPLRQNPRFIALERRIGLLD